MLLAGVLLLASAVGATLTATESSTAITIRNNHFFLELTKASGKIFGLALDGQDLLGTNSKGLYYDCYCTPSGFYTPGADNVTLVTGTDTTQTDYAGIIVAHTHKTTGQFFEKYWFVRDGETSVHTWTRLAYYNETVPFLRNLQELRSMFRPNTGIFTHLASNQDRWGPLPSKEAVSKQVVVQDATWNMASVPNDPYVQEVSDWFTKYTFSVPWRNHKAHGMYADGSTTNGTSYGAWLVMNTVDTYFGGPLHSDLVVDGIVYDYISSNHHGDGTPNITTGFDRTFGPVQYFFNSGGSLPKLLGEAQALADPKLFTPFYDSVAHLIQGHVPSSRRGVFKAQIKLPAGAKNAVVILATNKVGFQDNVVDTQGYQYWGEVDSNGNAQIDLVKEGTYRLTIYASEIFGDYTQDDIQIQAGKTKSVKVTWKETSAGRELWRIGTPDKSSGEFLHGDFPGPKPRTFPEYTIFWGAYDWKSDFPAGINFTVGKSDPAKDLNYIHWSVFHRPTEDISTSVIDTTSNWTINFQVPDDVKLTKNSKATFTVQLAGVKTASGNTDVPNGEYSDLTISYYFNNYPLSFVVPYYHSSSCGVRSEVSCYQVSHVFEFEGAWLKKGWNILVLSLPYNATNVETAVLPTSVYVQYDALRLEIK